MQTNNYFYIPTHTPTMQRDEIWTAIYIRGCCSCFFVVLARSPIHPLTRAVAHPGQVRGGWWTTTCNEQMDVYGSCLWQMTLFQLTSTYCGGGGRRRRPHTFPELSSRSTQNPFIKPHVSWWTGYGRTRDPTNPVVKIFERGFIGIWNLICLYSGFLMFNIIWYLS